MGEGPSYKRRANPSPKGHREMVKGLTPKERKLIKGVASGKTRQKAAIDAGYSKRSAHSTATDILKKPKIQAALTDLMDKMGLSDRCLLGIHKEMLGAHKTVSVIPVKGETEGRDATASSVEFVDVPDWQARGKALEMGYKLKGAFIDRKEISGPGGEPIPIRVFRQITTDLKTNGDDGDI